MHACYYMLAKHVWCIMLLYCVCVTCSVCVCVCVCVFGSEWAEMEDTIGTALQVSGGCMDRYTVPTT